MTYQIRARTPVMVANPKQPRTVLAQAKEAGTVRIEADRDNLLREGASAIEGIAFSSGDGIVSFRDWVGPMWAVSSIANGILVEFVTPGDQ